MESLLYNAAWRRSSVASLKKGWQAFDMIALDAETGAMRKLEAIGSEVRNLPLASASQLQDWLADYLEDNAELNPAFVASIERGKTTFVVGREP